MSLSRIAATAAVLVLQHVTVGAMTCHEAGVTCSDGLRVRGREDRHNCGATAAECKQGNECCYKDCSSFEGTCPGNSQHMRDSWCSEKWDSSTQSKTWECTENSCCFEKCKDSFDGTCPAGQVPQTHDWAYCHDYEDGKRTCGPNSCCMLPCSTWDGQCPTGQARRTSQWAQCHHWDGDKKVCRAEECCRATCRGWTGSCPAGSKRRDPRDEHECNDGKCSEEECCATTCGDALEASGATCPEGSFAREVNDERFGLLPGASADEVIKACCPTNVCQAHPDMTCPAGLVKRHVYDYRECEGGDCTVEQCCGKTCEEWHGRNACPSGTIKRDRYNHIQCHYDFKNQQTYCSEDSCCIKDEDRLCDKDAGVEDKTLTHECWDIVGPRTCKEIYKYICESDGCYSECWAAATSSDWKRKVLADFKCSPALMKSLMTCGVSQEEFEAKEQQAKEIEKTAEAKRETARQEMENKLAAAKELEKQLASACQGLKTDHASDFKSLLEGMGPKCTGQLNSQAQEDLDTVLAGKASQVTADRLATLKSGMEGICAKDSECMEDVAEMEAMKKEIVSENALLSHCRDEWQELTGGVIGIADLACRQLAGKECMVGGEQVFAMDEYVTVGQHYDALTQGISIPEESKAAVKSSLGKICSGCGRGLVQKIGNDNPDMLTHVKLSCLRQSRTSEYCLFKMSDIILAAESGDVLGICENAWCIQNIMKEMTKSMSPSDKVAFAQSMSMVTQYLGICQEYTKDLTKEDAEEIIEDTLEDIDFSEFDNEEDLKNAIKQRAQAGADDLETYTQTKEAYIISVKKELTSSLPLTWYVENVDLFMADLISFKTGASQILITFTEKSRRLLVDRVLAESTDITVVMATTLKYKEESKAEDAVDTLSADVSFDTAENYAYETVEDYEGMTVVDKTDKGQTIKQCGGSSGTPCDEAVVEENMKLQSHGSMASPTGYLLMAAVALGLLRW